ncbi:hypothetical protein R3W88_033139 [Solanum pinnatisectum]|uniref:Uncharacterized protein n=1 Tax=Solanum pinnatisectum TaxID=50273 RepID=A0AAV9K544_9SOLN|nr:hypothetical protein R3W88_033139 [Solanum pinnatisectum]
MTTNTKTVVNPVDTPVDSTTRESATVEENWTLRHVMVQLWQAWANGHEPLTSIPDFPEITSIRSLSSQVPISDPFFPPRYGPFDLNNPTIAIAALVYTLPQPTVTQRATQEGQFTTHPEQYSTPGIPFGGLTLYNLAPLLISPTGTSGMIWLKILLDNFSTMSTLCQIAIHSLI